MKNKTELISKVVNLYANNFVVYYKAHAFHFHTQGPTFVQDHRFLQEIYEFLITEHDNLGEQVRQLGGVLPPDLKGVLGRATIEEYETSKAIPKVMFSELANDFEVISEDAEVLYEAANSLCYGGLETYLGDYLRSLSKLHWKLKATLGDSI